MNEIYIKVKGRNCCLYRAVEKEGKTIDFLLNEKRETKAAKTLYSARATLASIELSHRLRKGQYHDSRKHRTMGVFLLPNGIVRPRKR